MAVGSVTMHVATVNSSPEGNSCLPKSGAAYKVDEG